MTAGPVAGPASAYPMLRTPASTCFNEANEAFGPPVLQGRDCAFAEANVPNCAAAIIMDAVPRKRRRSLVLIPVSPSVRRSCPLGQRSVERGTIPLTDLEGTGPIGDRGRGQSAYPASLPGAGGARCPGRP